MGFDLKDYVDVATRLRLAHERWPELRVEEQLPEIVNVGQRVFIQSTVTVWRTPDDPRPTSATVWEPWPGQSSFTKDSEVMVGNTSALGRALAYMGLEVRKGIASRDEVAARQDRPAMLKDDRPQGAAPSAKQLAKLNLLLGQFGLETRDEKLTYVQGIVGREVASSKDLTPVEAGKVIDAITATLAAMETPQ